MRDGRNHIYRRTINGKLYLYFRWPDQRSVGGKDKRRLTPLPGPEGSPEFRRAVTLCLRELKGKPPAEPKPVPAAVNERVTFLPGTAGHAIEVYLASKAFENKAESTKEQYRRTFDQMRDRIGVAALASFDVDAVDLYSEELESDFGPSVADRHVKMLSNVWKAARKRPEFKIKNIANPTEAAERRYTVKRAHRPWPLDVQRRFMAAAPEHLKLAKLLLHFAAQRGGDSIKLLWTDYDGRGLVVRPQKDRQSQAEAMPNYHLCPKPLREALDAAPREAPTILVNGWGKPYANANVLSNAIRRVLIGTGDVKEGERSFVMHGLRKSAARDVGSLGVGAPGIKTVGGWRSNETAEYYAAEYDRRRVNAATIAAWDAELERQEAEEAREDSERAKAAAVKARRAQLKRVK